MSIKTLINDINYALESEQEYQEDDQAGMEQMPLDCLADAMAYRQSDIRDYLQGVCDELGYVPDERDLDALEEDILHFHIKSRTGHIFSSFDHNRQLFIDSRHLQEHHLQIDLNDGQCGRITEGRLEVMKRHLEAVVSSYTTCMGRVTTLDLCWATDAVWVFFAERDDIKSRIINDYIE